MISPTHEKTQIPNILKVKYKRYIDHRGFFSETSRVSDLDFIEGFKIVQSNESLNVKNTIRGLHFQWDPPMGKLVRCIMGTLYDILLDIRIGSPTFGNAIILELTRDLESDSDMWVWLPPGIAHGFFCEKECIIEYLCSGEYNKAGEGNVSPFADDIDWSLADSKLLKKFKQVSKKAAITDKDKEGPNIETWLKDSNSKHFTYNND